jgi:hypothetical protein
LKPEKIMFKNSDSDSDIEDGHVHNGRVFRGVHLENMFKKNYEKEGFYNGEEADLTDEERAEPSRPEEGATEELHQDKTKKLGTVQVVEISIINPPIVSTTLGNQIHQSPESVTISSSTSTQTRNPGSSMADEMRFPIFRGDGSEDPDQH